MVREKRSWAAVFLLLAAIGCRHNPVAPALTNSRVYENPSEGFRFLVPEDWIQTASADLPPGPLDRQHPLVRYSLRSTNSASTFMVLCISEKQAADLQVHHAGPFLAVEKWTVIEPLKTVTINGATAERIVYEGVQGDNKLAKMVTCFRRNGRLYSFVGVYHPDDETARQEVERATEGVIWNR